MSSLEEGETDENIHQLDWSWEFGHRSEKGHVKDSWMFIGGVAGCIAGRVEWKAWNIRQGYWGRESGCDFFYGSWVLVRYALAWNEAEYVKMKGINERSMHHGLQLDSNDSVACESAKSKEKWHENIPDE